MGAPTVPRARRLEVEQVLRQQMLLPAARPFGTSPAALRETLCSRLVQAARELGPVFIAWGHYLGSRADLFPAVDCQELQTLPTTGTAVPFADIVARLEADLGAGARELMPHLLPEPYEVGLFQQTHRAPLAVGKEVLVRVVPFARELEIARDLALLPLLQGILALCGVLHSKAAFADAFSDFRRTLTGQLDAPSQAEALAALARDGRESQLLVVPAVHPHWTSSRVLTVECLPGTALAAWARQPGREAVEIQQMAQRISLVWLRQALTSAHFPVTAEFVVQSGGQLALVNGTFATLPASSRANLWGYVRATASHDPDRACSCILRELEPPLPAEAQRVELRQKMRQGIPFRDGSWTLEGESLAESVILHWRFLHFFSIQPSLHLLAFYRGIFWLASYTLRLQPQSGDPRIGDPRIGDPRNGDPQNGDPKSGGPKSGDPLQNALEDLEWQAGWAQLRQLVHPVQLGESLNATLNTLLELPQRLDHVLDLFAGDQAPRVQLQEPALRQGLKNRTIAVVSLLVLLASFVLLATHPSFSTQFGNLGEGVKTTGFVLLGTLLLFLLWGRER